MKKIIQLKYGKDISVEEVTRISRRMNDLDKDILVIVIPETIDMKELSMEDLIALRDASVTAIKEKLDDYTRELRQSGKED